MCLMLLYLFFFFLHVLICIFVIVAFYIYIFDLYLSVFLRSTVSVICMHQGSESNAISILCMYGTCGRIDNKADFDFLTFD